MSEKIEPMSVEEIRKGLVWHLSKDNPGPGCLTCRLYLAWIHAEAKARFYKNYEAMHFMDQLASVKREVGWPEN